MNIYEPLKSKINGAKVMLADFNACNNFDVMHQLSKITIPVQIIVGSKDQMTPIKYGQYLQNELPFAKLDVIDGGTHMVFAENPVVVNQSIESFLSLFPLHTMR